MIAARRLIDRGHWVKRLAGLLLLLPFAGCSPSPDEIAELSGPTMGTGYTVKVHPVPGADRLERLAARIEQRLAAINGTLSTYLPDSDLSRFNRSDSIDWQAVPAEIVELVVRAQAISIATDGAYDITVNPLVTLWGFGSGGRRDAPPSADSIRQRLRDVGHTKLDTRRTPPALRKQTSGLEVDLSSIAKGWAVDELCRILESEGISDYLVDIGGEIRVRGDKGSDRPWQVAIEKPDNGRRVARHLLALRGGAVATSGDYRNYFEHEGQRYSHTIDPRNGQAVRHRLASVTVFANDATTADAWATALLALGETGGPDVADRMGIAALFISRTDDGLDDHASEALQRSGLLSSTLPLHTP